MPMHPFSLLALLSAALALGGCTPPDAQSQTGIVTAPQAPDLSNVVLSGGTAMLIPGTDQIVQFVNVISDSRCPQGVTCVWAGEIKVLLISGSRSTQARDNHEVVLGDSFEVSSYRVTLTKVEPEPTENQKIAPSDYRVTLEFEKSARESA